MTDEELHQLLSNLGNEQTTQKPMMPLIPSPQDMVMYYENTCSFPSEDSFDISRYPYISDSTASRKCIKISRHFPLPGTLVPLHRHDFIEMNYMYSGSCVNVVNNTEIMMREGDLLIMDTSTRHFIREMNSENILLNIIVIPQYIARAIEYALPGSGEISSFFSGSIYGYTVQPNYMFFSLEQNPVCRFVIRELIREYFDTNAAHSDILLSGYMNNLLLLLDRMLTDSPKLVRMAYKPNSKIAQILNHIRMNCSSCTLENIGTHFGYSTNYIQKLIKKNTGKGFLDMRNEFRLGLAEYKLHTTNKTVKEIAEECGFQNISYFYRQYRQHYGKLPREL